MKFPRIATWWTVAGIWTLIAAWMFDACIRWGNEMLVNRPAGLSLASLHVTPGSALYVALEMGAQLGLAPVAASVGAGAAVWLALHDRRTAAYAVATVAAVVLVFNARMFAEVDLVGWRTAMTELVVASRTTATTAVAIVVAFVLAREHLVARHTALLMGIGVPLAIGLSRISLGVHDSLEILAQWSIGADIAIGVVLAYLFSTTPTTLLPADRHESGIQRPSNSNRTPPRPPRRLRGA